MPYRFGGERKTQVAPAVAFAGAHRRLPLLRADEGGQAYVPAGFLAGLAHRGLRQAFVGLPVAGGVGADEAAVAVFQIGRASGRESVWESVGTSGCDVALTKK